MKKSYIPVILILSLFNVLCNNISSGPLPSIETIAGTGEPGFTDGSGASAKFNYPDSVTIDSSTGNIYIGDTGNSAIRKIDSTGTVSTIAGLGTEGNIDGNISTAKFSSLDGITVDTAKSVIYVADTGNDSVRKIDLTKASSSADYVTTIATGLSDPTGIVYDPLTTSIYVANEGNNNILQISNLEAATKTVTVLAGTGSGDIDSETASSSSLNGPHAITVDSSGILYFTDRRNNKIKKIKNNPGRSVETVTGLGFSNSGDADGDKTAAKLNKPHGLGLDSNGYIYTGDELNNKIKKIDTFGSASSFAGTGSSGDADGTAYYSRMSAPRGIALDSSGNIYVCDFRNHKIKKIKP